MTKVQFTDKMHEALFTFNGGYGDYLFDEFKKSAPELTANYCIPVTAVLLSSDDNHKPYGKYGKKFFTNCNGDMLDEFCKKHNISRFQKITKKKYKSIVVDLAIEVTKKLK
jgi:hypothetical protein